MTTRNEFSRGKTLAASAVAIVFAMGLTAARAQQDGEDHSKTDHSQHGTSAPKQWADPGKTQGGGADAGKADAGKADEHAGHHAGAGGGSGGMGGMMGGMGGMMSGGGMSGMNHGGGMGGMMSGPGAGGMSHGGRGGMGGMGGMMKNMMCGFTEHLEGRLAYLKAELKLTDSQTGAWNTFADAWRAAAQKTAPKCETTDARPDPAKPAVLSKLEKMESHMVDHLDIVRAQKAAIEPLLTALSDEQKKIASETFTSMMRVGMSMGGGMMSGGMGSMMGGGGMGSMMGGMGGGSGGMEH